jgi:hypothetical protein
LWLDLIWEPRDLWMGVFIRRWDVGMRRHRPWIDADFYLCLLPTLAVRIRISVPKGALERSRIEELLSQALDAVAWELQASEKEEEITIGEAL